MDLSLILTLLILILGILFLLAIIAPAKFTAWGGSKPHRGKAFIYLGVAFVLLLILGTMADDVLMKKIEETPEEITELDLSENNLKSFPGYLPKLTNLEELTLSFNEIPTIDENIRGLKQLRWLILDHNPISEVPAWVQEFENLSILSLHNTHIDSSALPLLERLQARGVNVTFTETHITGKDMESQTEESSTEEAYTEDEHAESFWEFAKRRVIEGRGTDHRRKYGKGEIFYQSGIPHTLLDSLGAALTDVGLFTDDKEVSALLAKEDNEYVLKVVTVYKKESDISEADALAWQLIGISIQSRVFPNDKMQLHLCDQQTESLKSFEFGSSE